MHARTLRRWGRRRRAVARQVALEVEAQQAQVGVPLHGVLRAREPQRLRTGHSRFLSRMERQEVPQHHVAAATYK